ncbi:Putative phosphoserine phosphatase 2 [Paraconexibacter sp. AEG42_29]|uniref:Phosphoserine phosphatase 2 n=1 Tax=Paraconexibacter sp. AEG42_29 TaxID=2997339 RepID=A0AAU7AQM7_9ACTN
MRRLLLVRHAATPATRTLTFPADEALDARGLTDAAALARALPADPGEVLCSPAGRCRQTVTAAGLATPVVDARLAEGDFGTWAGRTLEEIHADDLAAATAWMTDPDAAPHGGESLTTFSARVGEWLDEQGQLDGRAVAVTHGGVIKAAIVRALGAPVMSFWRVDVAPLSITTLHAHQGRWTVVRTNALTATKRVGAPAAAAQAPGLALGSAGVRPADQGVDR